MKFLNVGISWHELAVVGRIQHTQYPGGEVVEELEHLVHDQGVFPLRDHDVLDESQSPQPTQLSLVPRLVVVEGEALVEVGESGMSREEGDHSVANNAQRVGQGVLNEDSHHRVKVAPIAL